MDKKKIDVVCLQLLECEINRACLIKFDVVAVPRIDLSFTVWWEVANLAGDLKVCAFETGFIHAVQEEFLVAVEESTVEMSHTETSCRRQSVDVLVAMEA